MIVEALYTMGPILKGEYLKVNKIYQNSNGYYFYGIAGTWDKKLFKIIQE